MKLKLNLKSMETKEDIKIYDEELKTKKEFIKKFFNICYENYENLNECFYNLYCNDEEKTIKLKSKIEIIENEKYIFYYKFICNEKEYKKFNIMNIKDLFKLIDINKRIEKEKELKQEEYNKKYHEKLNKEKELKQIEEELNNLNDEIKIKRENIINIYDELYKLL